jgi:hypothetical protein
MSDQILDGFVCDYKGLPYTCNVCCGKFTPQEWDARHSDVDGEDVHDVCCPLCHPTKYAEPD